MWNPKFIHSIQVFSSALTPFKGHHLILFKEIKERGEPPDFPYSNDEIIERCLLKLTLTAFETTVKLENLSSEHSYYAYMWFIYETVLLFWERFIEDTNFDTSGYFDSLIRKRIIRSPGIGIGYLSLLIARYVNLSEKLMLQIETSKALTPSLSFQQDEERDLVKITGSRDRLCLALLIALELGIACERNGVYLTTLYFRQSLWDFLYFTGLSGLEILRECLCRSERCLFLQGRKFTPNVLLKEP